MRLSHVLPLQYVGNNTISDDSGIIDNRATRVVVLVVVDVNAILTITKFAASHFDFFYDLKKPTKVLRIKVMVTGLFLSWHMAYKHAYYKNKAMLPAKKLETRPSRLVPFRR
jgi:hypothetical protein